MSTRLLIHTLPDPLEEENKIYKKRTGSWSKLTTIFTRRTLTINGKSMKVQTRNTDIAIVGGL